MQKSGGVCVCVMGMCDMCVCVIGVYVSVCDGCMYEWAWYVMTVCVCNECV